MDLKTIFDRLWNDYSIQNPSAQKIFNLFASEGDTVVNDHIAFRTLDFPEINIDVLAKPFISNGYEAKGEYRFTEKHLFAKHYELPGDKASPRIFISQLILSECSQFVQEILKESVEKKDFSTIPPEKLIFSGSITNQLSYEIYNRLREESEYAAWFYVFGFRANHFTVSVNALKKYRNIVAVNELLKKNGFLLNSSGGEIKGTPADLLQQSSTLADRVMIRFSEGSFEIPSCYYEFAWRYPDANGDLYNGFVSKSADKIFESTDYNTKK
jgi:hypothetical protein